MKGLKPLKGKIQIISILACPPPPPPTQSTWKTALLSNGLAARFYHISSHILEFFITLERYTSFTTFYLIPKVSYQYSLGEPVSISK